MDKRKQLLATLSLLALGIGASEADAQSLQECQLTGKTEAECACEAALEEGTLVALEYFLYRYPNSGTACYAQATTNEDRGGGGGDGGGGYGN